MTDWIAKKKLNIRRFPVLVLTLLAACVSPTPIPQAPAMTITPTPFPPQTDVVATALPSVTPSAAPIVEAACEDPPEGSGLPRYARLMHDSQWMPWPSRIADPDWPRGFL